MSEASVLSGAVCTSEAVLLSLHVLTERQKPRKDFGTVRDAVINAERTLFVGELTLGASPADHTPVFQSSGLSSGTFIVDISYTPRRNSASFSAFLIPFTYGVASGGAMESKKEWLTSSTSMSPGTTSDKMGNVSEGNFGNSSRNTVSSECANDPNESVLTRS